MNKVNCRSDLSSFKKDIQAQRLHSVNNGPHHAEQNTVVFIFTVFYKRVAGLIKKRNLNKQSFRKCGADLSPSFRLMLAEHIFLVLLMLCLQSFQVQKQQNMSQCLYVCLSVTSNSTELLCVLSLFRCTVSLYKCTLSLYKCKLPLYIYTVSQSMYRCKHVQ